MAVQVFISPYPSPWIVGQTKPKLRFRFADDKTRRPYDQTSATFTGKLGTVVLTGTFAVEDGPNGIGTYLPNANDAPAGSIGRQSLQIVSTNGGNVMKSQLFPIDVVGAL